jgi:hypothetical protein
MSQYIVRENKKIKVAAYDSSLMLTLPDIIPNDRDFAKRYLIRKEGAPAGKLRSFYNCKDNSALLRKIITTAVSGILWEVASGFCRFNFPAPSKAYIYMGWQNEEIVKSKAQHGKLGYLDLMQTDYKVPYITFKFSPRTKKKELKVYVNKPIYAAMVKHANTGEKFSSRPRDIDYFLPYVYDTFPYIEESCLKNLVIYGLNSILHHLKQGEEIRLRSNEGEIRFFRALGKMHDKIMREVVQRRIIREHNEKYDQFFT